MVAALRKRVVYGLFDPTTYELRYIGKSINGITRARRHRGVKVARCHRDNWILSLKKRGLDYEIEVIEEPKNDDALDEAERFWIAYFKSIGARLTNHTDGGDGWATGDRNAMRNPESVARFVAANKGRKFTDEHRARMSEAGRRRMLRPEEMAKMLGENNPAKRPEVGAKISAANRGMKRPKMAEFNRERARRQREAKAVGRLI